MHLNAEIIEFLSRNNVKTDEECVIYSGYSLYKLNLPLTQKSSLFERNNKLLHSTFFELLNKEYLNNVSYWFNERQYTETIKYSGIVIDIDAYQSKDTRTITELTIGQLVIKLSKIINTMVDIPTGDKTVAFVLLNPAPYRVGDQYKEGIHILFPGIKVDKMLKVAIIKDFAAKAQRILTSAGLHAAASDTVNYMVDLKSFEVPMQIYGTIRDGKTVSHQLYSAYNITFGENIFCERTNEYNYTRRVNNKPGYMPHNLQLEMSIHYDGHIKKIIYAPRQSYQNIVNEGYTNFINTYEKATNMIKKNVEILKYSSFAATEVYNCVECLSRDRGVSGNYAGWSNIMTLLLSIDPRYSCLAKLYSIECDESCWFDKNGEDELEKISIKVEKARRNAPDQSLFSKYALKDLRECARIDNPEMYKNIVKTSIKGRLFDMFNRRVVITQTKIAMLVCDIIKDNFKCIPIDKPGFKGDITCYWLEYITPDTSSLSSDKKPFIYKWCRDNLCPKEMFFIISKEISDVFSEMRIKYLDNMLTEQDKEKKKLLKNIAEELKRIIIMCESLGSIEQIRSTCKTILVDRSFLSKLDIYDNVIGVGNGILVFKPEGTVELVQSHGQYHISQTTDTIYMEYNPEDKVIRKVEALFASIFPDKKLRDGVFMHFSFAFVRFYTERYMTILRSLGSSGKSLLMALFETMWGLRGAVGQMANFGYYNTSDANVLMVEKKDPNGVDHQLRTLIGARLVHLPEGKNGGVILAHIVKRLNDNTGTRGMYGDLQNASYGGILSLISNDKVRFNECNYAVERRTLQVQMPQTFKPGLKKEEETDRVKCMDESLKKKVKKRTWGAACLSIMVNYWKNYKKIYGDNFQKMYEDTGLYKMTIDYLGQFNYIVLFGAYMTEKSPGASIELNTVCERYIIWQKARTGAKYEKAISQVKSEVIDFFADKYTLKEDTGEEFINDIAIKDM